jgi:hypothetical protein
MFDPPISARILLLGSCLLSPLLLAEQAPVLADGQTEASKPLIFNAARNKPSTDSEVSAETVQRLRDELTEVAQADLSAAEKRAQLQRVMREHPYIFDTADIDLQHEQAVDAAVLHLETLFFEVVAEDAPTPESKLEVLDEAPATQTLEREKPALIAPLDNSEDISFDKEVVVAVPPPSAPPHASPAAPAEKTIATASSPKTQQVASARPADHPARSLTAQASDPTAPLVQMQMTYLYSDVVRDSSDSARQFLIEPVIPIPANKLVPITQIIRPTVPFLDEPDGKSGLGDIAIQHVFLPEPHSWGALGFGYTATLPTADHRDLGAGKYQAGPATTIVYYGINNWQLGGTLAQSWSFAGNGDRDDVSNLTFQPIVNYLAGPWYIGIGDFTWGYDWKGNEGWNIPLGFQVGRITKIGKYRYNLSAELLWVAKHSGDGPSPERGIKFGFVLLLPE